MPATPVRLPDLDDEAQLRVRRRQNIAPSPNSIISAPEFPDVLRRLSLFDIPAKVLSCWAEPVEVWSNEGRKDTLTYWERVIRSPPKSGDLRDTPVPCIQRPEDWIVELEHELGYQPCLHPEDHYGRYRPALEVAIEHPIALDSAIMALRGAPVTDLGPKPSLMARRAHGQCAICGSEQLSYEPGPKNIYDDPFGEALATLTCSKCGTGWYAWTP